MRAETCEIAVAKGPIEARQGVERGEPFVVRGWAGDRGEALKELGDPQQLVREYGGVYVDAMVAVRESSVAQDQAIHFAGNISDHVSKRIRLGDVLESCVEHDNARYEHSRCRCSCISWACSRIQRTILRRQSRRGGNSEDSMALAYYVAQQPLTGSLLRVIACADRGGNSGPRAKARAL